MRRNARFSASADFVNSKGLCSPGEAVICSSACQKAGQHDGGQWSLRVNSPAECASTPLHQI
jgi:hypothetical protein